MFQTFRGLDQSISPRYDSSVAAYSSQRMRQMNIWSFSTVPGFFHRSTDFYAFNFCTLSIKVVLFFSRFFRSALRHFRSNRFFRFWVSSPYLISQLHLSTFFRSLIRFSKNVFPFPTYPHCIPQKRDWSSHWNPAKKRGPKCNVAVLMFINGDGNATRAGNATLWRREDDATSTL